MIDELVIYSAETIRPFMNDRIGEVVLGKGFSFINDKTTLADELSQSDADFVLFGIEEDIGVMANYGRPGAARAWGVALRRLVNVQQNPDNTMAKTILLGHLDFSDLMKKAHGAENIQPRDLHDSVAHIDGVVATLAEIIVAAGKIPIAIGGGHNNAYGMLKGTSQAMGHAVNALNIDAHADMRPRDYRHSGNGFSYALHEGFLNRYFVFGLHENYNSEAIYKEIKSRPEQVNYNTYEAIQVRAERNLETEAILATAFVADDGFGLEIDLDCVEYIPSSAYTPSGWTVREMRRLVDMIGKSPRMRYVHICEAAPKEGVEEDEIVVGKLISYLITDILRQA